MPPTNGDDFLEGGVGGDTIDALEGNDTVNGLGGDDSLEGNLGSDVLSGGEGADSLMGGAGADNLSGGGDNDSLDGGADSDLLDGGAGSDTLTGGGGFDLYINEPDPVQPDTTDYILDLEAGDAIAVGRGRFISWEPEFYSTFIGASMFSGVAGEIRYSASGGQTIVETDVDGDGLADFTTVITNGEFTLRANDALGGELEIDAAYGGPPTALGDTIGGTNGADAISGVAGDDLLSGADGADTIDGGDGFDTIDGSAGDDSILGGDGDDMIGDVRGDNTIDGGAGFDTYSGFFAGRVDLFITDSAISNAVNGETQTLVSIELITISQRISGVFDDVFNASAATVAVNIFGGAGDDVIIGGSGNDTNLEGDSGRDTLTGGLGADLFDYDFTNEIDAVGDVITDLEPTDSIDFRGIDLAAQSGFPFGLILSFIGEAAFSGAAGELRYVRGPSSTRIEIDYDGDTNADGAVTIGNGSFDLFQTTSTSLRFQILNGTATAGDDDLVGTNGGDTIDGLSGNDSIQGLAGDDFLIGGEGFDSLLGGEGNDTLSGGDNGDALNGGAGDDSLDGGGFGDSHVGGAGYDTFSFNLLETALSDEIFDFEAGDAIQIGLTGQTSKDPGADLITFIGTAAFSNVAGEVRYSTGGGQTVVEVDVNGDAVSDQTIIILNGEFDLRTSIPNGPTLIFAGGYDRAVDGFETVAGSQGGDLIEGGNLADDLSGLEGDDTILGGDGDDFISEGLGDDSIDGGDGFDSVSHFIGGPADVVITDTSWTNFATGEADTFASIETVFTSNRLAPASNDTLDGGAASIILSLHAGAGDDLVIGGSNDDLVEGDNGNDTLVGGAGADVFDFDYIPEIDDDIILDLEFGDIVDFNGIALAFQQGDPDGAPLTYVGAAGFSNMAGEFRYEWIAGDTVIQFDFNGDGAVDAQVIAANRNVILVETGPGSDRLTIALSIAPTPGDDSLTGTDGADSLFGLAGRDTIVGLSGSDTLIGELGDDTLFGGAGMDFLAGREGADVLDGGSEFDFASYLVSAGAVNVNLGAGLAAGAAAEGDVFISIEGVLGSNFDDTLAGDAFVNSLQAGDGADVLNGAGGDDSLDGSLGADTLIGGAGADALGGGTGVDTARYSSASAGVRVALWNVALNTGDAAGDTFLDIEIIEGSNLGDSLEGNGANNDLRGAAGGDFVSGGFGADTLFGQNGDDLLIGGAGGDSLNGGDGFDIASYQNAAAGVRVALWNPSTNTGDAAGDTVQFTVEAVLGSTFADNLQGNSSNNVLRGGAGADFLAGGFGDDTLEGGAGADDHTGGAGIDVVSYSTATAGVRVALWNPALHSGEAAGDNIRADIEVVEGSGFNDSLEGSAANNNLRGGAGNDLILGGGGNDTLSGGTGNDTLTGGAGNDRFVFEAGGGADRIQDFAGGAGAGDVITLTGLGAAFDTFGEVIAAATQSGATVVIAFGGGASLTLANLTLATLNADDFAFG